MKSHALASVFLTIAVLIGVAAAAALMGAARVSAEGIPLSHYRYTSNASSLSTTFGSASSQFRETNNPNAPCTNMFLTSYPDWGVTQGRFGAQCGVTDADVERMLDNTCSNYCARHPDNRLRYCYQTVCVGHRSIPQPGRSCTNVSRWCDAPSSSQTSPESNTEGSSSSSCVANAGESCSAANICGETNTGTVRCDGTCSVGAPADPSNTCSITNACGSASGAIGCNEQCNVSAYPVCEAPSGDSVVTVEDTGDGDGTFDPNEIDAQLRASPLLVRHGATTQLAWNTTETTSCTLRGTNGDTFSVGIAGERESSPITGETTYTLTCEVYNGATITDDVTVRLVPAWQEF